MAAHSSCALLVLRFFQWIRDAVHLIRIAVSTCMLTLCDQFEGTWKYFLGPMHYDNTVNCSAEWKAVDMLTIDLTYPDVAVSGEERGFWTRIYGQGAEIVLKGVKVCVRGNSLREKRRCVCFVGADHRFLVLCL